MASLGLERLFAELSPPHRRPLETAALIAALELVPQPVLLIEPGNWRLVHLNRAARTWLTDEAACESRPQRLCDVLSDEGWSQFEQSVGRLDGDRGCSASVTLSPRTPGSSQPLAFSLTRLKEADAELLIAVSQTAPPATAPDNYLTDAACRDELTGLLNRRALSRHLSGAAEASNVPIVSKPSKASRRIDVPNAGGDSESGAGAARVPRGWALFFVDVDGFKAVNDAHGHPVGDRVLREVAQRLASCVRPGDLVVRFGGDEFLVIVERMGARREAAALARRIRGALSAAAELSAQLPQLSASIGIAFSGPGGAPLDELIADADRAMYRAKSAAGRGYEFADRGDAT